MSIFKNFQIATLNAIATVAEAGAVACDHGADAVYVVRTEDDTEEKHVVVQLKAELKQAKQDHSARRAADKAERLADKKDTRAQVRAEKAAVASISIDVVEPAVVAQRAITVAAQ